MKRVCINLLAILAVAVSCNKEKDVETISGNGSHSISATIVEDDTKTTYTTDGAFSWVSGDKISYIVKSSSTNKYDRYQYSTTGSGSNVTFSGTAPSGEWSAIDYAFYPYIGDSGYTGNTLDKVSSTTFQAQLYGTIKAYSDRLKGIVPMIGKKVSTDPSGTVDNYHFYPVTGVLKLSFSGLPATASQIRLDVPAAATYPLNGIFNIDTSREIPEIKATDVATGYAQKYLNFDYSSANDVFYIPLPTGTIPAGALSVSVSDGTDNLYSVTNKTDIVISRGVITELPSITVPSIKVKIYGSADDPKAAIYFSGDVAYVKYSSTMTTNYGPSNTCSTSGTILSLPKGYNYKWPFQYQAYNSSDETIGDLQILYYYSITTTGISEVCKQFTSATSDIGLSDSKVPSFTNNDPFSATTPTITFEVSDDTTKGSIMVTEFCGISGKVYASYVDYQTASGTPDQEPPQIVTNNEVFCTAGGNDYTLKEGSNATARFAVKTTKYGTPTVYGQNADLVCWGTYVGLYSTAASAWGPRVTYFFDPED